MDNVGRERDEEERPKQTARGKKLKISVVEGSFRRIAGIREFADSSGTFITRRVEILREPGQSLGFYIRQGDGWARRDGVFVSRVNLGSMVETSGLLAVGDEIVGVNDIDVTQMALERVAVVMRYVQRLFLTVKVLRPPAPVLRSLSLKRERKQLGTPDSSADSDVSSPEHRNKSLLPFSGRVLLTDNDAPIPYAYTRIGPETPDDSMDDLESPGYETVRHRPLEDSGSGLPRDTISTESLRTLGSRHTEEKDVHVIDNENIDQSLVTHPFSGQLTLVLNTVDSLIPPSDAAPLICTLSCDSHATVEVSVPANQIDEGVAHIQQEYHIHLTLNHSLSLKLVNGLLSSVKTLPLAYFFPNTPPQAAVASQEFALTLSPIGRLRFSVAFSPLPMVIPRWGKPGVNSLEVFDTTTMSSSDVPSVLGRAIRVIEEYGIETSGLYQITADEGAKREALAACQSESFNPSLLRSLVPQLTVHAFTGVLIDFFLNLPQPIFSTDFTASLQDAVNTHLSSDEGQLGQNERVSLVSFIECLPDNVLAMTSALLGHLRRVCQHGATNNTTVDRLSQLFVPLLFTPAHSDTHQEDEISCGDFSRHTHILKMLILHYK